MAKQKYTSEDDDDLDTTMVEEKAPEIDSLLGLYACMCYISTNQ